MTSTPFIPGRNGTSPTDGPFQRVIIQLQDNNGDDYDGSNTIPIRVVNP